MSIFSRIFNTTKMTNVNHTGTKRHDPISGADYEVRYQTGLSTATPSRDEDELLTIRLVSRPRSGTPPQYERTIPIAVWLSDFTEIHHITDGPQVDPGTGTPGAKPPSNVA